MGIPDQTYFGEKPEGGGILYGEVRTITDEQRKLEILKSRIETFLIRQVNSLTSKDEIGNYKVWSPFPLNVLTLLAIETLGRIIGDLEKILNENEYEQSKVIVTPIYQLIDKNLARKPTKAFYKNFEKIHNTTDKKAIRRYSDVIHKYQRNTFNHGYQAKGVYLDHTLLNAWEVIEDGGYIIINPYLFWDEFKKTFYSVFEQILNRRKMDWRTNALKYFDRLLQ